jgi:hypothetical protein
MLPKIEYPTYELTIPSTGKTVMVRPFLVKEEKILLMAAASDDDMEIVNTTKQIIQNCILNNDVDVEKLPFFDIDYLFIALRAKSIGEKIDMRFTCNNVIGEQKEVCNHVFIAPVDIAKARIVKDDTISMTVPITDKITIKLKYPTYSVMRMIKDEDGTMERKIKVLINCIDQIVNRDIVTSAKDYSKDELRTFIESFTEEQFTKLSEFVENFPSFVVDLDAECGKCGFNHHIEYTDYASFFY